MVRHFQVCSNYKSKRPRGILLFFWNLNNFCSLSAACFFSLIEPWCSFNSYQRHLIELPLRNQPQLWNGWITGQIFIFCSACLLAQSLLASECSGFDSVVFFFECAKKSKHWSEEEIMGAKAKKKKSELHFWKLECDKVWTLPSCCVTHQTLQWGGEASWLHIIRLKKWVKDLNTHLWKLLHGLFKLPTAR